MYRQHALSTEVQVHLDRSFWRHVNINPGLAWTVRADCDDVDI